MAVSDAFLQELKYRCDIETVISKYVTLKKSGRSLKGLCPFHSEKTPSFTVSTELQLYHCFGCGAGGDVITFIMKIENLDYVDALKFLAAQAGIRFPEEDENDTAYRLRHRVLEMNREAAKFYHHYLFSPGGRAGLQYFQKRQLTPKTITGFGLGYAPDSWDGLLKHLKTLGYGEDEIVSASLAFRRKSGGCFDAFRNRVMFPIIDVRGAVVGFGGRVLGDGKPKYLNSPDTPAFKKSRCLFALNFAKKNPGTLILCEGYMDVIAMHQAGFTNAVATLGTALTQEQARLIARYAGEVVLSYDSDEPGQKATRRAIRLLDEAGLKIRVLKIEDGKDPDEYIKKHGADRFRRMLEKSGGQIQYRLESAKSGYDLSQLDQKAAFLKDAAAILATITSLAEREVYASKLAQELGIAKEALLTDAERIGRGRAKAGQRAEIRKKLSAAGGLGDRINPDKPGHLRAAMAEETLLAILYKFPEYIKQISGRIAPENFVTAFNRRVYEVLLELASEGGEMDFSRLAGRFDDKQINKITEMVFARQVSGTMEEAVDCINVIKRESELLRLGENKNTDPHAALDIIKKSRLESKKRTGGSI